VLKVGEFLKEINLEWCIIITIDSKEIVQGLDASG
jgi:hypothetical protein